MMLVQCTGCNTAYRIADEKIPPGGVKVRCPKCRVVFAVKREVQREPETLGEKLFGRDIVRKPLLVERPKSPLKETICQGGPETAEESPASAKSPEQAVGEVVGETEPAQETVEKGNEQIEQESTGDEAEKSETQSVRETVREMVREMVAEPVVPPSPPCGAAQPEPQVFPFETKREDPRTLARALISDVLFYNREKRDKGLAEGKVLAYLSREIARSWEFYKDRVGIEKAVETDYFREAVNEILGEGKKLL